MSLGHVYIVLEPIGSTHLTFGGNRYYEFLCFDVPNIVWSPGCDRGHEEESQNGRDIKIDILEGYVWTPEWFRMGRAPSPSTIQTPHGGGPPPGLLPSLSPQAH